MRPRVPSDFVMVAIMGAAAIEPALAAIRRGVMVALANKECVVAAGEVFRDALEKSGAQVHPGGQRAQRHLPGAGFGRRLAKSSWSPSPPRAGRSANGRWRSMRAATVEQAVAHPNWAMGRKISLDSATLMNKGLELIEAHFLFALPPEKLGVVVHPQSIVHCLVSYDDGTTMAHLSAPDMRTPIAHALGWPRRIASPSRRLDLAALGQLVFQPPAHDRFPALDLAIDSMRSGGLAPTVLNAANEIAVQAFLDRRIGFLDIPRVVGETLTLDAGRGSNGMAGDLDTRAGHRCAGAGAGRRNLSTGRDVRGNLCSTPCAALSPGPRWACPPFCSSSPWWCSSMSWAISWWRAPAA